MGYSEECKHYDLSCQQLLLWEAVYKQELILPTIQALTHIHAVQLIYVELVLVKGAIWTALKTEVLFTHRNSRGQQHCKIHFTYMCQSHVHFSLAP